MALEIIETESDAAFVQKSTEMLRESIVHSIEDRGACIIGLSGGSTPRPIYEALGKQDEGSAPIDWSKVSVFLVDERYTPPGSNDSNQQLVRETLLVGANIPEEQIAFPDTSLPLEQCIADYDARLRTMWDEHLPDIITLGMGEDGHIASLFPPLGRDALDDTRLVLHTVTERFAIADRISVSLNTLAAASRQFLLLKGEGKRAVWEEMQTSDDGEARWPLKRVLETGDCTVIVGV